jgi:hypothetical protein
MKAEIPDYKSWIRSIFPQPNIALRWAGEEGLFLERRATTSMLDFKPYIQALEITVDDPLCEVQIWG